MEEITQQYIKEVEIDSDNNVILLKTSGSQTLGLDLNKFLANNFKNKIIKLIEPSNGNDPFIILDDTDYEVWKY